MIAAALAPQARRAHATRSGSSPSRASRSDRAPRGAARGVTQNVTWEIRTFGAAAAAIGAGFLLAVLYLGQITGWSVGGYEQQRLAAQRDELRRQSSLVEVQLAKLDAPSRIETEARRLGLTRLSTIPVMPAPELQAHR